ncbi:IDEAL domain-containing protein [Bacillus haikouensis]|uniref:IDEAL domain-containing protein n=1 Tax=Bacillus haikouensis TaxID=1510468 RepID=UPI001551C4B1|nr:IDEAL domain-containing protein [Bacillus haikouensis]NQD64926.1 IDEAL domain-containing protein [Bacillus haikouensis]
MMNTILTTGDWVKGISRDGELIIGYIENLDFQGMTVRAKVVTSDNRDIEGSSIPLLAKDVTKLPDARIANKEQIRFLIDLSLSTEDEEWFLELTEKLNAMRELVKNIE